MITLKQKGDFSKTNSFLERLKGAVKLSNLDAYGEKGVAALQAATPVDTGKTAKSWSYKIVRKPEGSVIEWYNSNIASNNVSIALLIQYGHGTSKGTYIQGKDFINPAMAPVFNSIAEDAWREVNQ